MCFEYLSRASFWATVCKTVRPMLSDRCLSVCLSVCDVGVLWPNGWMDQNETWHGGRPRLLSHCVRWELISPMEMGTEAPTLEIYGSRPSLRPRPASV